MKKLLLILLCLPMIGFGQDSAYDLQSTTFYDTTKDVTEEVVYETEEEQIFYEEPSLFYKIKIIFMEGDILFMSILSFLLLATLSSFVFLSNKNIAVYLGLTSLFLGNLFTFIRIIRIFDLLEVAGDFSLFMSILSFLLLVTLLSFIFFKNKTIAGYLALMSLLLGNLFIFLAIIGIFDFIEMSGSLSPSLVSGGMKVVMITTVYGLIISIISIILRLISLIVTKR